MSCLGEIAATCLFHNGCLAIVSHIVLSLFLERYAPYLLCEACLLCKRKGTLELVPSNEASIVITSKGMTIN